MKRRRSRTAVAGVLGVVYGLLAVSAHGVLNNGFETDWLYASQGGGTGNVIALDPVTGQQLATLDPSGVFWSTMTFAGTGANNARLFLANPASAPPATDVTIVEMNAAGTVVKSVLLKSLANFPANPTLVNAGVGNMRYSIYHGTLFLSLTVDAPVGEDANGTGTTTMGPAVCYEIDLALTQVLNTYLGPVVYDAGGFSDGSSPRVEINPTNGDLYMCGQRLNKSTNIEGDLIVFDTSGGSTSTFTVLINGDTYNPAGAGTGDDLWRNPSCPVYRGTNHPGDARPTLMIINTGTVAAQNNVGMEFYLDEVDGNGNLVKRGDRYTGRRRPWNGQLDEYTGAILATRVNNQQSGLHDAGLDQVFPDDAAFRPTFQAGVNNTFLDIGYGDVDSPGFRVSVVEPPGTQTATSFVGGGATPNTMQFTFRNKGYRNPDNAALPSDTNVNRNVSYAVTKVPDDGTTAWLTLDKTAPAAPLAPDDRDTVTATINAVGLDPGAHSVDLHFADDASPPNVHVRRVEVQVFECSWEVTPTPVTTAYVLASLDPMTYEMEVRQTGGLPLSYTVQEVAADGVTPEDHSWLTLNKTSGGPIGIGQFDTVEFTVNSPNQVNTGYVRFVPSCGSITSGAQPEVRTIQVVNTLVGGAPFVSEYNGDMDPLLPDSCGLGCNFGLTADAGNLALGEVVDDPEAVDNQAWRIADDGAPNTWTHFRTLDGPAGFASHDGNLGSTLVVRVKVASNTAAGTMFTINQNAGARNATRLEWGLPAADSNEGLVRENARGAVGADNGAPRFGYTIIRVASGFGINGGRTIRVWVNEDREPVPVPLEVLSLFNLVNGPAARGSGYGFGMEGTAAVTGEVLFDYVAFTTAGMFGPDEEVPVLGRSLVQVDICGELYADTDADGDVDSTDFAQYQRCVTEGGAPVPLSEECFCFDRNADGGIAPPFDLAAFILCADGPDVPADPACDD